MPQEKPLQPVPKGVKYLRVFCHGCDTLPGNICRKTGLPVSTCENGEKQRYKIIKYEGKVRKTITLQTRDLNSAISIAGNTINPDRIEPPPIYIEKPSETTIGSNTPVTLIDWFARFSGLMKGDAEIKSIYSEEKEYSLKHLQDYERYQKYFLLSLKEMGRDVENMKASDIGEAEIKNYKHYILYVLKLSDSSHDKAMALMGSFMNAIKKMGYEGKNVFAGIPHKAKGQEVKILSNKEIKGMLSLMDDPNPENHIHSNGKSMKKSWNRQGILLGALTGRRNEEISVFKWDNLTFNEDGSPKYLKLIDLKASRKKGIEKTNPKMIYIPIIPELKELLAEMGLEKYKNSDKYILAPKETITRDTVKLHLSRMFTFYYDKLGTGEHKKFKYLRRTYISRLASYIGVENTRLISGHSGISVMEGHYLNPETLAINETTKNMTILGSSNENREKELKTLRKQKTRISLER